MSKKTVYRMLLITILVIILIGAPYPVAKAQRPMDLINTSWIRAVDTVNGILFPRLGLPAFVTPDSSFNIVLYRPRFQSDIDRIFIKYVSLEIDLDIVDKAVEGNKLILNVSIPPDVPNALYDLFIVSGENIVEEPNSVAIKDSWQYPLKILRYSDTHYDNRRSAIWQRDNFLKLIWRANFINPDFVIITGDILNTATEENYKSFRVDIDNLLRVPLVLVPGNHDHHYKRDLFTYYVGLSNISINVGPLHLILVDTGPNGMNGWIKNDQIRWLEQDLKMYSEYEVKIIASHHPFSMLEESPESNRSGLENLLEKSDVDLILHGHMHYLMAELNTTPIRITDPNAYEGGQPYSGFRIIYVNAPHDIEWRYNGKIDPYPLFKFNVTEYQKVNLSIAGYSLMVRNEMEVSITGYIDIALPPGDIKYVEGISRSQLNIINFSDFMRVTVAIKVESGEEKIVKIYMEDDKTPPDIYEVSRIVKGKSLLLYINVFDRVSGISRVEVKYSYDNSSWEERNVYRLTPTLFYSEVRLPDEGGGVAMIIKAMDVEGNIASKYINHSLIIGGGVPGEPTPTNIENLLVYTALIMIILGVASVIIYVIRKK